MTLPLKSIYKVHCGNCMGPCQHRGLIEMNEAVLFLLGDHEGSGLPHVKLRQCLRAANQSFQFEVRGLLK